MFFLYTFHLLVPSLAGVLLLPQIMLAPHGAGYALFFILEMCWLLLTAVLRDRFAAQGTERKKGVSGTADWLKLLFLGGMSMACLLLLRRYLGEEIQTVLFFSLGLLPAAAALYERGWLGAAIALSGIFFATTAWIAIVLVVGQIDFALLFPAIVFGLFPFLAASTHPAAAPSAERFRFIFTLMVVLEGGIALAGMLPPHYTAVLIFLLFLPRFAKKGEQGEGPSGKALLGSLLFALVHPVLALL